jgi:hypothetical protein
MSNETHTDACYEMPECIVCGLRKKPWGRSAPLEMANGLCDSDCEGYAQEPRAGHYWPDEKPSDRREEEEDEHGIL